MREQDWGNMNGKKKARNMEEKKRKKGKKRKKREKRVKQRLGRTEKELLWFDCCMMMSVRQLVGFVSTCCVEHERPYYNYKQTTVKPQLTTLFLSSPTTNFTLFSLFFRFFPFFLFFSSIFLSSFRSYFPNPTPSSFQLIPSFYPTFHSFCVFFFSAPGGRAAAKTCSPFHVFSYSFLSSRSPSPNTSNINK